MTRPTPEQIKALRKGDVVTVRAVVRDSAPDDDGDISVFTKYANGKPWITYCDPSEIMTIEPREIKVGDGVRTPNGIGFVRHIEGNEAAVFCEKRGLRVFFTSELEIIP